MLAEGFQQTLTDVTLQRIAAYNQPTSINTIVSLNPSLGADAASLDTQLQSLMDSGSPLPSLFCVPFIVKVKLSSAQTGLQMMHHASQPLLVP